MLKIGDPIPSFELTDGNGELFSSSQLLGNPAVIFFFPKSGSPVCTKEACHFRDAYPKLSTKSAKVIGISRDTPQEQGNFAKTNQLGYPVLSDPGGKVAAAFGVPTFLGIMQARITFVVDKDGLVIDICKNSLNASAHVTSALKALEGLS